MRFIYSIGIQFYYVLILLASPFNSKASLWIKGRKGWKKELESLKGQKVLWVHAASLGEFEQGKPVIDKLKKQEGYKILLTFFSPSGFEVRKDYPVDKVMYLPIDSFWNAKYFISTLDISIAIFIKYEFWYNFLFWLNKKKIPTVFISVLFRSNQIFFKLFGGWFRKHLKGISEIFVQGESSKSLLNKHGIENAKVAGDTRFDSVIENMKLGVRDEKVELFKGDHQLVVFGSTWPADLDLIIPFINSAQNNLKFVIAPHEIKEGQINDLVESLNTKVARYTIDEDVADSKVLIVDTIGVLKNLYKYSEASYIGGGFGVGIHNTLEAVVNNKLVLFGPNFQKFQEAKDLVENGGGVVVNSLADLQKGLNKILSDADYQKMISEVLSKYVNQSEGASKIIMSSIEKLLLDEK